MKKNTYRYFPKVNRETNDNLVTKKMILSKRFSMKSLKIATSYLLSSTVAISILGIGNKSLSQNTPDERDSSFYAVMRLGATGEEISVHRKPTLIKKVNNDDETRIGETESEDSKNTDKINNEVGVLVYTRAAVQKSRYPQDLYPTTIVQLSDCKTHFGWCRLESVHNGIEPPNKAGEKNEKAKINGWEPMFYRYFNRNHRKNSIGSKSDIIEAWVPVSYFCDTLGKVYDDKNTSAPPLVNCSVQTNTMVCNFLKSKQIVNFDSLKFCKPQYLKLDSDRSAQSRSNIGI